MLGEFLRFQITQREALRTVVWAGRKQASESIPISQLSSEVADDFLWTKAHFFKVTILRVFSFADGPWDSSGS